MPNDLPQMTGSEIQAFVENTLKEIKTGTKNAGFLIDGSVNFNLEVTEKKEVEGGGGFKQFIRIGGKKEDESIQKVNFSVKPERELWVK